MVAVADRVLKPGGFIFLEDFDTGIPFIRKNKHNKDTFTYKYDYSKIFLSNPQYYLCEKTSYSHKDYEFSKEIQERVSAYIIYKEIIDECYYFS